MNVQRSLDPLFKHKVRGLGGVGAERDKDCFCLRRHRRQQPPPFPLVVRVFERLVLFLLRGVARRWWWRRDGQNLEELIGAVAVIVDQL